MPIDLAKKLGKSGIIEVISVMWDGYHDIFSECIITPDMQENTITQEWFIRVSSRWNKENRAARIRLSLTPVTQYEDDTLAKPIGQPPTIDFCFRAWNRHDGYFGAECKNLFAHDQKHIKRYVATGVDNYISGRYGSKSTASAMIGYVLSGRISEIIEELRTEIAKEKPHLNLQREMYSEDPQYKSMHYRVLDGQFITLHHLFFNFASEE